MQAYETVMFGKGRKVHFKSECNSLCGVQENSPIKILYKDGECYFLWLGLKIPIKMKKFTKYDEDAFCGKVCFVRITRKFIRGRFKYYAQVVFEGPVPIKGPVSKLAGPVGIDIGTRTAAVSSAQKVSLLELAPDVQYLDDKKADLLRKMDRSRRANNPDNYNPDGQIKRRKSEKIVKDNKN
jgi:hypothetical protein